jgi:hypothetical protein
MSIYQDRRRGTWVADVQKGDKRVRRKGGSSGINPDASRLRKSFKTREEAEKWHNEASDRLGVKPKRNYNHKSLDGIIDSAVEDGRVTEASAKKIKSISSVNEKRNYLRRYITILDDGKIEYKPFENTNHWRSSPYLRNQTAGDKRNIIHRVNQKLYSAKASNPKAHEELTKRLNLLKDVNSTKDLVNWESDFNTSYDELLGNKPIYITDSDQIDRVVRQRVNDTIRHDKKRTTRYKIDDGSWVTNTQLKKLREQGANPTILEEILPGYFDEADEAEIRAKYTRQLTDYLKGGGDLRKAPHFGHKYPIVGIDESGKHVSSAVTTATNVGAQDPKMNLKLGSKVTPEMLGGKVSEKFFRGRGFFPGWLGMATLPLWLLAPDRAQAVVDKGEEIISSTADKILPQGLIDYAKNIGSKVDNYIGQAFDRSGANNPRTIPEVYASIGQMLYEGAKQTPGEIAGLGDWGINAAINEYKRPDRKKRADEINLFNSVYSP